MEKDRTLSLVSFSERLGSPALRQWADKFGWDSGDRDKDRF